MIYYKDKKLSVFSMCTFVVKKFKKCDYELSSKSEKCKVFELSTFQCMHTVSHLYNRFTLN